MRSPPSRETTSDDDPGITAAGGLSGFVFGGDNFLGRFADDQRVERLKGCAELERALKACVARRDEMLKASSGGSVRATVGARGDDARRRDDRSGAKIARFFRWGGGGDAAAGGKDRAGDNDVSSGPSGASSSEISSCARETHEAWACRGMALGCASDLVELKKCFREKEEEAYFSSQSSTYAGNDANDGTGGGPKAAACAEEQRKLGTCAAVNAARLQERIRNRSRKDR